MKTCESAQHGYIFFSSRQTTCVRLPGQRTPNSSIYMFVWQSHLAPNKIDSNDEKLYQLSQFAGKLYIDWLSSICIHSWRRNKYKSMRSPHTQDTLTSHMLSMYLTMTGWRLNDNGFRLNDVAGARIEIHHCRWTVVDSTIALAMYIFCFQIGVFNFQGDTIIYILVRFDDVHVDEFIWSIVGGIPSTLIHSIPIKKENNLVFGWVHDNRETMDLMLLLYKSGKSCRIRDGNLIKSNCLPCAHKCWMEMDGRYIHLFDSPLSLVLRVVVTISVYCCF